MADARLRELERRWRASGAVEDHAALLAERVRAGDLDAEALEVAACCGSPVARLLSTRRPTPLARDGDELLADVVRRGGERAAVWLACAAVAEASSRSGDEAPSLAQAGRWLVLAGAERDRWEAELARSLPGTPDELVVQLHALPRTAGADLALRAALANPEERTAPRRRHVEGWCARALGLSLDLLIGPGSTPWQIRRRLPPDLRDRLCSRVIERALADLRST